MRQTFPNLSIMILFLLLSNQLSIAQKKLRLADCFEIARANRSEIKNARLEIQNSGHELSSAKQGFLPTLNAGISHNLNYTAKDNPLWGQYSGNAHMGGSMPLFDWFNTWKTIELANTSLNLQNVGLQQEEFLIGLSVVEAFYNLLFRHEQFIANKRQLSITDSILNYTKTLFESGKIIYNDVEESRLQYLKEENNVVVAKAVYDQALVSLKNVLQMNGEMDIDFDYYQQKEPEKVLIFNDYAEYEKVAIENNPFLELLFIQKESIEMNHLISKSQNRPSLGINYSLSSTYSQNFMETGHISLRKNLEDTFGGLIEFKLVIPVFNRRSYKTDIAIMKNNIQKQQNIIDSELNNLLSSLKKQFLDARSTVNQFTLSEQEFNSIQSILKNRTRLYVNGKDNIFMVLTYKRQYNEIENALILLKFQSLLKNHILHLYETGGTWDTVSE